MQVMTMIANTCTLLVLALVFFPSSIQAQLCDRSDTRYVTCDHTTPVCECTTAECYFCFEVEQRHTFTRYFLTNDDIDIPGYGGRVVYFNDQGQLQELPPENPNETPPSCLNDSSRCTDAYTTDGNSFRPIITVNNRFPAPTLVVPNNTIVVVDVYNKLGSEATSIHWHGMHQMNTPWMDGVEHITQCGIAPSSSFRYIFRANPPGTHWYHSHSGAQRTDGLFGALIVRESVVPDIFKGLYPVIDKPEYAITLIDWQKENSLDLFAQIHAGIRYFEQDGVPPTPWTRTANAKDPRVPRTCSPDGTEVGPVSYWSGLINGLGRHPVIQYNKTRLSTFTVSTHRYYRFRLIGAQSLFAYRFSIDEHNLVLIATDGHFVEPTAVDFIIIHSGERYDFILVTKNPSEIRDRKDFIIRAETLEVENSNPSVCSEGDSQLYPLVSDHNAEAILHYGSDSDIPTNTMYDKIANESVAKSRECLEGASNCIAINCPFQQFPSSYKIQCLHIDQLDLLEPITDENRVPDVNTRDELFFNFGFEGDGSTSAINGRNFVFPSTPLQLDNNKQNDIPTLCDSKVSTCDSEERLVTPDCLCTQLFNIEKDKSYRFIFTAVGPNRTDNTNWNFAHPVHLHGHSFHVAKIGFGTYNSSTGRIESASDNITCQDNSYICTNPQWTTNSAAAMGRRDLNRAPLKDTVLIPAGGYAVVYFKANNPGYWFLHCHIEVHQLEGMSVVINEAQRIHIPPPAGMPECGNFTWTIEQFKSSNIKPSTPEPVTPEPSTSTPEPVDRKGYYYDLFVTFCVFFVVVCTFDIILLVACLCRKRSKKQLMTY